VVEKWPQGHHNKVTNMKAYLSILPIAVIAVLQEPPSIATAAVRDSVPKRDECLKDDPVKSFCEKSGAVVDGEVYRTLRDCLTRGNGGAEEAERIWKNVTVNCTSTIKGSMNALLVAEVLRLLAQRWESLGVLDKAEAAYEQAYRVMGAPSTVWGISLLSGWTKLNLRLGNLDEANVHADLCLRIAQSIFLGNRGTYRVMVVALLLKATVLRAAGSTKRAIALERQAAALSAEAAGQERTYTPVP